MKSTTIERHAHVIAEIIDVYIRDNALGPTKLTTVSDPGGTSVTLRAQGKQAIALAVTPELAQAVEEAAAEEAQAAPQEPASKPTCDTCKGEGVDLFQGPDGEEIACPDCAAPQEPASKPKRKGKTTEAAPLESKTHALDKEAA
jgi:hypothetical protein